MTIQRPRLFWMADRNNELIYRLAEFPEVIGILCHGSFSNNPRHDSDDTSDLDITVIIDSGKAPSEGRAHIDWANFKSYQAMPDGKPLEVDLYLFDINDTRPWTFGTKEGYSNSASLVFDRDGRCQTWLNRHIEMLPEAREEKIRELICSVQGQIKVFPKLASELDKRLEIASMVRKLEEVIYWINWEYPADTKWRFSILDKMTWKPSQHTQQFAAISQTKSLNLALCSLKKLLRELTEKVTSEGIEVVPPVTPLVRSKESSASRRLQLERLWTWSDKYSAHTPKKCIKRGLPENAHDVVWFGVENTIQLLYALNNVECPDTNKYAGLSELPWLPREAKSLLYRAATVRDYGSNDAAADRADALRELFKILTKKVAAEGLFDMGSLYSEDFINQSLFGENAIFTHMFREGKYLNRQQSEDTYAVRLLKRVSLRSHFDENMLWGCCCQYFVSTDEELVKLSEQKDLEPVYKAVLGHVIPQLN